MSDKAQQLSEIIEVLKLSQEKTNMFFLDSSHCMGFLQGISFTASRLNFINYDLYKNTYNEVARSYGWTWTANSFYMQLKEEGLEDIMITKKLLEIEIKVWSHILKYINQQ